MWLLVHLFLSLQLNNYIFYNNHKTEYYCVVTGYHAKLINYSVNTGLSQECCFLKVLQENQRYWIFNFQILIAKLARLYSLIRMSSEKATPGWARYVHPHLSLERLKSAAASMKREHLFSYRDTWKEITDPPIDPPPHFPVSEC